MDSTPRSTPASRPRPPRSPPAPASGWPASPPRPARWAGSASSASGSPPCRARCRRARSPTYAWWCSPATTASPRTASRPTRPTVTEAMVRTFVAGRAGVSALARRTASPSRSLDLAVDADLGGPARRGHRAQGAPRLRARSTSTDALTREETEQLARARRRGRRAPTSTTAPQLLMTGDLGIGNTTPAAALVAAVLGLPAEEVTGRGTGIDDAGLGPQARRRRPGAGARARAAPTTPSRCSPRSAAPTSPPRPASSSRPPTRGVPVVLDGLMSVACALLAEAIAARCGRVVGRRAPLDRAGPDPRAEDAGPRAAARPRHAARRGIGRRRRPAGAPLRDRGPARRRAALRGPAFVTRARRLAARPRAP